MLNSAERWFELASRGTGMKMRCAKLSRFLAAFMVLVWAATGASVHAAESQGPQITNFKIQSGGVASMEWFGATNRIVIEVSASLSPPNWQRIPGVEWPINGTNWAGAIPRSGNYRFLRIVSLADTGGAPLPSKTVSLDLVGIHDLYSQYYNGNCIGCHGDRATEVALDGRTPTAHSRMLSLFNRGNRRCVSCHGGADFLGYSNGGLREPVDMEATECFVCHGKGLIPEFYAK
jgi:hypothetical protein